MIIPEDVVTRFWARVDRSGGHDACWEWRGPRQISGHGSARITKLGQYHITGAHCIAYAIANNGIAPRGMVVMHLCENPPCCNPRHLEAGTYVQNNKNSRQRWRFKREDK